MLVLSFTNKHTHTYKPTKVSTLADGKYGQDWWPLYLLWINNINNKICNFVTMQHGYSHYASGIVYSHSQMKHNSTNAVILSWFSVERVILPRPSHSNSLTHAEIMVALLLWYWYFFLDEVASFSANNQETESPSRRTSRIRTKPKKYGDFLDLSPTKQRSYKEILSSDEEEFENVEESNLPKPTGMLL